MAAKVTRTITTTNVCLFCANKETESTEKKVVTLTGKFKDENAMFRAAYKKISDENLVPVSIIDFNATDILYGMDEEKFIANAEVIKK